MFDTAGKGATVGEGDHEHNVLGDYLNLAITAEMERKLQGVKEAEFHSPRRRILEKVQVLWERSVGQVKFESACGVSKWRSSKRQLVLWV